MNRRSLAGLLLLAALLPMGCKKPPPPPVPTLVPTPTPMPAQDRLAYVSHGALYTVHTDGSAPTEVYSRPDLTLWFPSAAPSGTHFLCWASSADGSQNIARIEADGSRLTLLTDFIQHPRSEMKSLRLGNVPVYSHKGDRIAFSYNGDIWVMDADGTNLATVVSDHHSWSPSWSPDDRRLAYVNGNPSHTNVWVTDVDDRDTYQVTDLQDAWAGRPRFGQSGKVIYFVRSQKESDQVASVPAEVSEPLADSTPITKGDHFMGLELAPDLMKLVFVGSEDSGDSWDLYMANIDGSRLQRLTHSGMVQAPAWLHPALEPAPSALAAKPPAPAKALAKPAAAPASPAPSSGSSATAKALEPAKAPASVKAASDKAAAGSSSPAGLTSSAKAAPTASAAPSAKAAMPSSISPAAAASAPAQPAPAASAPKAAPAAAAKPGKAAPLKISVAVHFVDGGERIDPSSLPTLAKLAVRVKQYAGDQIRVQGPLDASALDPRFASATDRSLARAQSVRDWLSAQSGIPASGIDALPYTPPVLGQQDQGTGLRVIIQLR
jgi:outer membrane protein OmpA-like peptidoglycan-associated protein